MDKKLVIICIIPLVDKYYELHLYRIFSLPPLHPYRKKTFTYKIKKPHTMLSPRIINVLHYSIGAILEVDNLIGVKFSCLIEIMRKHRRAAKSL